MEKLRGQLSAQWGPTPSNEQVLKKLTKDALSILNKE